MVWLGADSLRLHCRRLLEPHSFQKDLPNLSDSHGSQAVRPMDFAVHGALGFVHAHFRTARLCMDGQAET
jgi:hypothetical protein